MLIFLDFERRNDYWVVQKNEQNSLPLMFGRKMFLEVETRGLVDAFGDCSAGIGRLGKEIGTLLIFTQIFRLPIFLPSLRIPTEQSPNASTRPLVSTSKKIFLPNIIGNEFCSFFEKPNNRFFAQSTKKSTFSSFFSAKKMTDVISSPSYDPKRREGSTATFHSTSSFNNLVVENGHDASTQDVEVHDAATSTPGEKHNFSVQTENSGTTPKYEAFVMTGDKILNLNPKISPSYAQVCAFSLFCS
jgi:hypothetical protein